MMREDLSGEAPNPAAEARIADAGPLTSLLPGGIFTGLAVLAGTSHPAEPSTKRNRTKRRRCHAGQ